MRARMRTFILAGLILPALTSLSFAQEAPGTGQAPIGLNRPVILKPRNTEEEAAKAQKKAEELNRRLERRARKATSSICDACNSRAPIGSLFDETYSPMTEPGEELDAQSVPSTEPEAQPESRTEP
jgi:hypothetical protein